MYVLSNDNEGDLKISRKIKFRVRCNKTKKLFEGENYLRNDGVEVDFDTQDAYIYDISTTPPYFDNSIELSTGIADKNGVEIYEGDIVILTRDKGDCASYPSYLDKDETETIKCEIRWVDCGLKACWGHEFCNQERIHSGMEIIHA